MKKTVFLIFVLLFIIGCKSLENMAQELDEESLAMIEQTELLFLDFQFNGEKDSLNKAGNLIKKLEVQAENNKYFEAKVFSLYGKYFFLKNNPIEAKTFLIDIRKRNKREENLYILEALLTKEAKDKVKILETALDNASTTGLIVLFLGDIAFLEGNFEEATIHYDDAFSKISSEYHGYYQLRRDLAYRFMQSPPKNVETVQLVLSNALKIIQVLQITFYETTYLEEYTDKKQINWTQFFATLKENELIVDKKLKINDPCTRAVLAHFLLHIVAYLENDDTLLSKYLPKFDPVTQTLEKHEFSPIPDIDVDDYFYNAVLVLVEREIMELPNGEDFF
ncbi:MAG: hypothetical protein MJB14_23485, partial [Spirochaetes bacterium]|nr:hypothetical protein [Spirochaetota bacterium]